MRARLAAEYHELRAEGEPISKDQSVLDEGSQLDASDDSDPDMPNSEPTITTDTTASSSSTIYVITQDFAMQVSTVMASCHLCGCEPA